MLSQKVTHHFIFWLFLLLGWECANYRGNAGRTDDFAREVAIKWNRMLLDLERFTPGYKPPVSARMFAYINLAAYETLIEDRFEQQSMEVYLQGYQRPGRDVSGGAFCSGAALNATYSSMVKYFFPKASSVLVERAALLQQRLSDDSQQVADSLVVFRSEMIGRAIAKAVWEWSTTDSVGHNSYLGRADASFHLPECEGCWQSVEQGVGQPMLPSWGRVRSFIVPLEELEPRAPASYSEAPGSYFYNQAMEVFALSHSMSKSNQWISEFWSDDVTGLTITPAGRWISIASQALENECPSSLKTVEVYLKTSLALSDALVACWALKYQYNVERPRTYINRLIQKEWQPYLEDPPFPSYPAGHAMLSSAAAEVLDQAFGVPYELTDYTHDGRQEYAGMPRAFHSFSEMAQENALSRLMAGVHYRMDCDEGTRLGSVIGKKIAILPLKKQR